jgi:hypothetical protein
MIVPTGDSDAEEKKVLVEALSDGEIGVRPSQEYVAQLRNRLLSVAAPGEVVRGKSNRRILLGSILGACAAAILFAAIWFSNGEPAWASAIRTARRQAWIHAEIERDDMPKGEIWVSPERDIVAAKLATAVLFLDYKHDTFLRYDLRERAVFRASQPPSAYLIRGLSSVSSLAAMFRRSPGAPALVPNEPIERWRLQSGIVDGIPCDEYEIVIRRPDRPATTLLFTIDKRESLPRSLTVSEGESHALTSHFDYPAVGPLDESSPLLGIPADASSVDVDRTGELSLVGQSLRKGRDNFDDYTSLSFTSQFDDGRPLTKHEVKRVLRRANKWRVDSVYISDPDFAWPSDHDQALRALRANKNRFRFVPELICDGQLIYHYIWRGLVATDGRPIRRSRLSDDSPADLHAPTLLFPERACRPIFEPGGLDRFFDVTAETQDFREGLIRVAVSRTPHVKNSSASQDTYWLDPALGNVAVRMELHLGAASAKGAKALSSGAQQIVLQDFKESPRGFWYPTVVSLELSRKSQLITRLYVDFTDVPSDEMFRTINPAP